MFHCFSNGKPEELKGVQRSKCWLGNGGMTHKAGTKNFAAIDQGGSISLFDGLTGQLKSRLQAPKIKANLMYSYNSIEFSPSGLNFLNSTTGDSSLFVFGSASRTLKQKWIEDGTVIFQARWVDEIRIMAGLTNGLMLLYELGKKQPIRRFNPKRTNWILDFDFSKDKKTTYCVDDHGTVFKIGIEKSNDSVIWSRKAGSEKATGVRVSNNEKYLAICDWNQQVHLIASGDGSILSCFNGFSSDSIHGIHWFPNDQAVLAYSQKELVILKLGGKASQSLEKLDEMEKGRIGGSVIISAHVYWRNNEGEKSFIVMGDKKGRVFRVRLE